MHQLATKSDIKRIEFELTVRIAFMLSAVVVFVALLL